MCVQYIGGCSVHRWCSVHKGDIMSTFGGYHEYIGGISWVHWRDIMSTSGDVQYIGGIPWVHQGISWVHWRMFSTLEGYYDEYLGIPWVHQGMFSTLEGYHEYTVGYHDYIGECSVHQRNIIIQMGEQLDKILSISIENSNVLNIPQCTDHLPMYSWYPPDVLNINRYTQGIPLIYWTPPNILMVSPRCTHVIPPMYSW